jgi:hypothetical protein
MHSLIGMKAKNTQYDLGRIICPQGPKLVLEGSSNREEYKSKAFENLDIIRKIAPDTIEWSAKDSKGLIKTEDDADKLIEYIKTNFPSCLVDSGLFFDLLYHGKLFFY